MQELLTFLFQSFKVVGVKRKAEAKNLEPQKFVVGETVLILRPSPLWAGCTGTVFGFANGLHRIRIEAKPDGSTFSHFRADIEGSLLQSYI